VEVAASAGPFGQRLIFRCHVSQDLGRSRVAHAPGEPQAFERHILRWVTLSPSGIPVLYGPSAVRQ